MPLPASVPTKVGKKLLEKVNYGSEFILAEGGIYRRVACFRIVRERLYDDSIVHCPNAKTHGLLLWLAGKRGQVTSSLSASLPLRRCCGTAS